jgi:hypothetical protein
MMCLEARTVVGVNPREELGGGENLLSANAHDLCSAPAALHQAAAEIAVEGHHPRGRQRLFGKAAVWACDHFGRCPNMRRDGVI